MIRWLRLNIVVFLTLSVMAGCSPDSPPPMPTSSPTSSQEGDAGSSLSNSPSPLPTAVSTSSSSTASSNPSPTSNPTSTNSSDSPFTQCNDNGFFYDKNAKQCTTLTLALPPAQCTVSGITAALIPSFQQSFQTQLAKPQFAGYTPSQCVHCVAGVTACQDNNTHADQVGFMVFLEKNDNSSQITYIQKFFFGKNVLTSSQ